MASAQSFGAFVAIVSEAGSSVQPWWVLVPGLVGLALAALAALSKATTA